MYDGSDSIAGIGPIPANNGVLYIGENVLDILDIPGKEWIWICQIYFWNRKCSHMKRLDCFFFC